MGREDENQKKLELYLHIPFCIRKCDYCDFLSMPVEEKVRRHYVNVLQEEIKRKAAFCREYQISSVFWGGGTPSILSGEQVQELMESLRKNFSLEPEAEITLECNPGTLEEEKLACYREAGVNRLSIGLQSAINEELKRLGRVHTVEQFLENFSLARRKGFENINVDLISALPGQNIWNWEYTLRRVLELRPEHLSAYSLIVEEGTPFYEWYGEDEKRRAQGEEPKVLPGEETERKMYEMTRELLEEKGYQRYEISNYAMPGKECRHNLGYWQCVSYLGLGLGSASLMEEMRFLNTDSLEDYLKGEFGDLGKILQRDPETLKRERVQVLDQKQQIEEFMFLGLRVMEGVSKKEFFKRFGRELAEVYGEELKKFQSQGLLAQRGSRVFLTEKGIDVSNYVMSGFLNPLSDQ
ncbi:MAG: oxygen-independent coproporphyrinogen III oxidase [Lachnospiraceae bacterium]|nr:oxygen-independent coproporphyrinogen III oxidase [Lachnospiraceae bacterium]